MLLAQLSNMQLLFQRMRLSSCFSCPNMTCSICQQLRFDQLPLLFSFLYLMCSCCSSGRGGHHASAFPHGLLLQVRDTLARSTARSSK